MMQYQKIDETVRYRQVITKVSRQGFIKLQISSWARFRLMPEIGDFYRICLIQYLVLTQARPRRTYPIRRRSGLPRLERGARMPSGDRQPNTPSPWRGKRKKQRLPSSRRHRQVSISVTAIPPTKRSQPSTIRHRETHADCVMRNITIEHLVRDLLHFRLKIL